MRAAVEDTVALKFAEGFYQAVWAGQSFDQAFKFGCSAIDTAGLPNEEIPVLLQACRSVDYCSRTMSAYRKSGILSVKIVWLLKVPTRYRVHIWIK